MIATLTLGESRGRKSSLLAPDKINERVPLNERLTLINAWIYQRLAEHDFSYVRAAVVFRRESAIRLLK